VAFAVHVARRPELAGPWTGIGGPGPDLDDRLAELDHIMATLR